jgi:hypothetical protein
MQEIESLKNLIISQLKTGNWDRSYHGFENQYLKIEQHSSGWIICLKLDSHSDRNNPNIYLTDIMNIYYFYYLKIRYVNKSIRESEKRKNLMKIADYSKKFLIKNKSLLRDSKLDDILS